jgi:hypothetical protein
MRRILFMLVSLALAAGTAHAQFIGYTLPQSTQQTLATNLACTGSPQILAVNNLGQTQHYLSIASIAGSSQFQAVIQGIDKQGNIYQITDVIETAGRQSTASGSGYFPKVQVSVTCSPNTATFSASYSGAWGTFNTQAAAYLLAQIDKLNILTAPANADQSDSFQTPYGSSGGTVYFQYAGGGNAGGVLNVICSENVSGNEIPFTITPANVTTLQTFQIPDTACPFIQVQYGHNGAGTGTVTVEYVFAPPGTNRPATSYAHITGTTATAIKAVPGYLHTLTINTGAAGTVTLSDLASGNCTGTPATNTVAVITATTTTLQTFTYDVNFNNGICLKASAGMDLTVSYQ